MYKDMRGVMVKFPFVASPEMSLSKAENYMLECNIRHLPLIENDSVVGLVSQRDLAFFKKDKDFETLTLGKIVKSSPFVVNQDVSLVSVLNIMAKNKLGSALITNDESQLIGIFTTTDALVLLENLLSGDSTFYQKPGEVIYLKDVVAWN